MQREYFLGGASPRGFQSTFWDENQSSYGILLKGGPGTGKSTLMKKIAAAFPDEPVSVYHCASDPHSLDAVVLEQRGVYIADATAPHTADTPLPYITGEVVNLAEGLDAAALHSAADEIRVHYAENQALHAAARQSLSALAAIQTMRTQSAARALDGKKLAAYAVRLCKRLIPKQREANGLVLRRQASALTPQGRLTYLPAHSTRLWLLDPYMQAAQTLLAVLTENAAAAGLCVEITADLTQNGAPITCVYLPALRLFLAAVTRLPDGVGEDASVIGMRRFYDTEALRKQRTLMKFCKETADAAEAETAALLHDALTVHDALEAAYIRALDTAWLDDLTERIKQTVTALPRSC